MFDVLTYQKGGSVLRMLEQFIGARRLPRRGPRLPHHPRLRQHRDRRPVGRPRARRAASRSATIMDTWIFQGGYPLVAVGDASSSQAPFSYRRPPPGERHRRRLAGPGASSARSTARRRPERLLLSGEPDPVAGADDLGGGQRRGSGYYRVSYPSEHLDRPWPPPRRPRPPRAVQPGVRHLGRRARRAARRWPTSWPWRRRLGRRATTRACGRSCRGARPVRPDRPRATAARRCAGAYPGAARPPRRRASGWEPPPSATASATPSCARSLLRTLGTIGDDPGDPGRGGPALRRGRGGGRVPRPRHRVGRPRRRGRPAAARRVRRVPRPATASRPTPQEEIRYLYALAAFADVDAGRADLRRWPSTEVRTQNAPFLIQLPCSPTGWPARRLGAGHRGVGRDPRSLPHQHPAPAWSDGVRSSAAIPIWPASSPGSCDDHPLPSGERSVAQTLERLEVNVAFGQREGAQLGSVLAENSRQT